MLLKWGIGGAICGFLMAVFGGGDVISMTFGGLVAGIMLRKTIFATFWM